MLIPGRVFSWADGDGAPPDIRISSRCSAMIGHWQGFVTGQDSFLPPGVRVEIADRRLSPDASLSVPVVDFEPGSSVPRRFPLHPFGALTAPLDQTLWSDCLQPTLTLGLRDYHGSDLDLVFAPDGEGRLCLSALAPAGALASVAGVSLGYDELCRVASEGGDVRDALAEGGRLWGPLDLVLVLGGLVQDILERCPVTADDRELSGFLRRLREGELRSPEYAEPGVGDLSAVLDDFAADGRIRAVVEAEETVVGWRVALEVSDADEPGEPGEGQPFHAGSLVDALRSVAVYVERTGVVVRPMVGEVIRFECRRGQPVDVPPWQLSRLGLV